MTPEQLARMEQAARRAHEAKLTMCFAADGAAAFIDADPWTPSAALALVERLRELERQLAVACKVNVG